MMKMFLKNSESLRFNKPTHISDYIFFFEKKPIFVEFFKAHSLYLIGL